jgi:hypothetical protein
MSKEPPLAYSPAPPADPPSPARALMLMASPPRPPLAWLLAIVAPEMVSAPPVE